MKKILFVISLLFLFSCNKKQESQTNTAKMENRKEVSPNEKPRSEIKDLDYSQYFKEAKEYCKSNNLNQDKFILIDLGLHSGLKRFFVYDFQQKKILNSYM